MPFNLIRDHARARTRLRIAAVSRFATLGVDKHVALVELRIAGALTGREVRPMVETAKATRVWLLKFPGMIEASTPEECLRRAWGAYGGPRSVEDFKAALKAEGFKVEEVGADYRLPSHGRCPTTLCMGPLLSRPFGGRFTNFDHRFFWTWT